MLETKNILSDVKQYLKENYSELYIEMHDGFLGCKFNTDDKYYILFISNYQDTRTLTYRTDINAIENNRINIEDYSINQIVDSISIVLNQLMNKTSAVNIIKKEKVIEKKSFQDNIVSINKIYYQIYKLELKKTFTEEEYESYIDFAMEIGAVTIEIVDMITTPTNAAIFKERMNIIDTDSYKIKSIAKEYNMTEQEVNNIIKKICKDLREYKDKYVILFNKIADKDILNYLIVGILNAYSKIFLRTIFQTINTKLSKIVMNKIDSSIEVNEKHKEEVELSILGDINYSLINYPERLNPNALDIFEKLTQKGQLFLFTEANMEKLKNHNNYVAYNSELEKNLIEKYDIYNFVKGIKTQSLVIEYDYNGEKYRYYPDFQILTNNDRLVIVEAKPLRYMFDKKVMIKYGALKKYCEQNGFGYLMIDDKNDSFETLENTKVNEKTEYDLIELAKDKKIIKYSDYMEFKRSHYINTNQLAGIIIRNYKILEFDSNKFSIRYIGE